MLRVWLTCAFATALVVGAVVLATGGPSAEPDASGAAPPPLSEKEVRLYNDVYPQIRQMLSDGAIELRKAVNKGKVDGDLGMTLQAQVDAALDRYHLTRESWRALCERVEEAINRSPR